MREDVCTVLDDESNVNLIDPSLDGSIGISDVNDNDQSSLTISIDDAIDRLGYGPFQRTICVAAGLCFASDAMEVLLLSFLSIALQMEWGLSKQQTAFLTSVVFLGALVGTLTLGYCGDRVGRRPVFLVSAVLLSVFGIATALCQNFYSICIIRMVVGFGVGGLTVPFDILAEILPVQHRGTNLLFIEYFWTAGTLCVPFFAYLTLGNTNLSDDGIGLWRYFVILCAVPCILSAIFGAYLVPESPRWLLSCGQDTKALQILRNAAVLNGLDPLQVFPVGSKLILDEENEVRSHNSSCHLISELFSPLWRSTIIRIWITWGCFAFLYYSTILATALVFSNDEKGSSASKSNKIDIDYEALIISCSAEFFGTTFAILLIDRLGRIGLQNISLIFGTAFAVTMLIVFNFNSSLMSLPNDQDRRRFFLIALSFLARWFMMSLTSTCWVATAEILPTEIRTTGHSTANAVARIGGFIAPYVVASNPSVIMYFMSVSAVLALIALNGLPETRGIVIGQHLPHERIS
jgi:MFS family permease